ncbi:MAG: hypothetical protein JRI68_27075 [Deltaproteobacteria bacterium]|nr:hypothetical protein [Deltaproteobacteria bacterium]
MLFVVGLLILLLVAPPLLVVWLVLTLVQRKEVAQYRTMVDTPCTPIAQVGQGGLVALQGQAVASDQGTVTSPISGRVGLALYLDVKAAYRKHSQSGGLEWRVIHKLREKREFWLDDGSGRRAWISPHDAPAIMLQTRYGGTRAVVIGGPPERVVEMTPAVDAWARQTTGEQERRLCVEESVIDDGAPLYAIGWAFDHEGVPVLRCAPGKELTLSTLTEAQLLELIHGRSTLRTVLLVCGCLSLVAGVVMIVLAIVTSL